MTAVLVSAGDASGDLHAAGFVQALRERRPGLRFLGLGGSALEKAGVEIRVHQRDLAIGGFLEVASSLRRIVGAWRRLVAALREERPALAVLVDSPDFHIPFARRARRAGVPVLFYVSPQVWAWRRGRVRKLARRADRMAAIFPFEPAVYAGTGLEVEFVGHPLVDPLRALAARLDRDGARAGLGLEPPGPWVALLPGSRRNELKQHLPLFLEAARALQRRRPDACFVLALAPSLDAASVEEGIRGARLPDALRLVVVRGRAHEAILASDAVLAKPGTTTVEVVLLDRPLVVTGRGHPVSVAVLRRLANVPSMTMANLIADAPVVPELLQEQARPEAIADALSSLLDGPAAALQRDRLAPVRAALGRGGAAQRAAAMAEEMLDGTARA